MSPVHEPVELGALPPKLHDKHRVERGCEMLERSDGQACQLAEFRARDGVARDAGPVAEIRLPPAAQPAKGANRDGQIGAHLDIVTTSTYHSLTES